MFPGANASVYRNEAGEPIGWDYPTADDPYDPDDFLPGDDDELDPQDFIDSGQHGVDRNGTGGTWDDDTKAWVGLTWECARCGYSIDDEIS